MDTTARATCWSVTINNPTASDDDNIALARQMGWIVSGQKEQGASETPHYQLMVKTPQVRFSAVKRQFPRAHIEVARDKHALQKYVNKEDTRVGQLPENKKYPTMAEFWMLVYHHWSRMDKDCLNYDALLEGNVRFYYDDDDRAFSADPLPWMDEAARRYIRDGYHVETLATNPAVRSAWKKFGREILERCHNSNRLEMERENNAQTDRQTDSVEIPVVSEINADESSPPQVADGVLEGRLGSQGPACPTGTEDQEGRDEDCEECDRSESGE